MTIINELKLKCLANTINNLNLVPTDVTEMNTRLLSHKKKHDLHTDTKKTTA